MRFEVLGLLNYRKERTRPRKSKFHSCRKSATLFQFVMREAGFVSLTSGVSEIGRRVLSLKICGGMHQLRDAGLYQHSP